MIIWCDSPSFKIFYYSSPVFLNPFLRKDHEISFHCPPNFVNQSKSGNFWMTLSSIHTKQLFKASKNYPAWACQLSTYSITISNEWKVFANPFPLLLSMVPRNGSRRRRAKLEFAADPASSWHNQSITILPLSHFNLIRISSQAVRLLVRGSWWLMVFVVVVSKSVLSW